MEKLDGINTYNKIQIAEVSSLTAQGISDVVQWINETVVVGAQGGDQGADGGA